MHFAGVTLVIGTRPEAIKLAPVARALGRLGRPPAVILTGQHPLLDPGDHGFESTPLARLHLPGGDDPVGYAQAAAQRIEPLLRSSRSLVVVQGDTASAWAGAVAAGLAAAPLAHVEAGLRTHDPLRPWPEEGFRAAIDRCSQLLFAPTALNAANLRREGVGGEIHVTGNSGLDALLAAAPRRRRGRRPGGPARLLVTCHRRESWREGLRSVAAALVDIAAGGGARIDVVTHPNPVAGVGAWRRLQGVPAIRLLAPCGHREMIDRMMASDLLLSDSGGVQEEAPALGIPLLVLREVTERPEAVVTGNMVLVGTCRRRIVAEVRRLLDDRQALAAMARPAMPFGDGEAASRIAAVIDRRLGGSGLPAVAAA